MIVANHFQLYFLYELVQMYEHFSVTYYIVCVTSPDYRQVHCTHPIQH